MLSICVNFDDEIYHLARVNCWYDSLNTHLSFDTKFKSFRTYAALLQGHNCQITISPAQ